MRKPNRQRPAVTLTLDATKLQAVKDHASAEGVPLSAVVDSALDAYLERLRAAADREVADVA